MRAINTSRSPIFRCTMIAAVAFVLVGSYELVLAQQARPKTFASADDAAQALYQAVKHHDQQAVDAILGAGPELTSSGDAAEDNLTRDQFVRKYDEMHRLVNEADGTTVLYIGAENWPFPFPLVAKKGKWLFDADAGEQEVVAREIGGNEITAIQVCQAVNDLSTPNAGTTSANNPIREFVGQLAASKENISAESGFFRGYYFRRVAAEKPADAMLIAYPAEYRASGVMTFAFTRSGSLYEKDLGSDTATVAQRLRGTLLSGWVPVEQ